MRESDLFSKASSVATSQDSVPMRISPAKEDDVLMNHSDFLGRLMPVKCFETGS